MHPKDFVAVAAILAAVRDRYPGAEAREAVEVIEGDLCRVFKRLNPAINAEWFKRASWPLEPSAATYPAPAQFIRFGGRPGR